MRVEEEGERAFGEESFRVEVNAAVF